MVGDTCKKQVKVVINMFNKILREHREESDRRGLHKEEGTFELDFGNVPEFFRSN